MHFCGQFRKHMRGGGFFYGYGLTFQDFKGPVRSLGLLGMIWGLALAVSLAAYNTEDPTALNAQAISLFFICFLSFFIPVLLCAFTERPGILDILDNLLTISIAAVCVCGVHGIPHAICGTLKQHPPHLARQTARCS
jgi:hypothetical protein